MRVRIKNKEVMKKGRRMAAVLLYLALVSLFLGLRPWELFNLHQLLLVLAGGLILYFPGMPEEDFRKWKKPNLGRLARDMVYASLIETFVLLFIMLSDGEMMVTGDAGEYLLPSRLLRGFALSMRPLLYGSCIWIAFGSGGEGRDEGTKEGERAWAAQESYERFLELGLTRREAEVAVQICKGLSNKEIAAELSISETTVKKHVSNIFEKLNVEKRQEIKERLTP